MSNLRQFQGLTKRGDAVASDEVGQVALFRDSTGNAQVPQLTAGGAIQVSDAAVQGFVDNLETLVAATNTALSTVNSALTGLGTNTDGLETLIAATNTALGTVNTALTALQGYTDGLEALIGTSNTNLTQVHTDLATTLAGLISSSNTLATSLNGYVDQLEGYMDGVEGKLDVLHADLIAALIANITKVGGTDLQSGTTGRGALPVEIQDPATGLAAVINPSVAATSDYPYGATPLSASSGNVANAAAAATLAGAASKTTYCAGFTISGAGATAALVVDVTVTGAIGGTMTYTYAAVAGAALMNQTLNVKFDPPLAASGQNTAIVVSCPALGTGALKNTANSHGYQL